MKWLHPSGLHMDAAGSNPAMGAKRHEVWCVDLEEKGITMMSSADLGAGSGAAATSAPALTELITRMGAVTAKLREIVDGSGGAGVATGADAGSGSNHA